MLDLSVLLQISMRYSRGSSMNRKSIVNDAFQPHFGLNVWETVSYLISGIIYSVIVERLYMLVENIYRYLL